MLRKKEPQPYTKQATTIVPFNPTTTEIPPFTIETLDEKRDAQYWDDHGLMRGKIFGYVGRDFISPIWTANDPNHPYVMALDQEIAPFNKHNRGCKMAVILSNDKSVGITLKHDFSSILSARKNAVELRYTIENFHTSPPKKDPSKYQSPRRKNKARQNYILCSLDVIGRWNRDETASMELLPQYCESISENPSTKEKTKFFCLFEKRIFVRGHEQLNTPNKEPSKSPLSFLSNIFKSSSNQQPITQSASVPKSDPGPFKNLPQDIMFAIISFLDSKSYAKFMQVNKFFAYTCQDEKAFKSQCLGILHLPQSTADNARPAHFNSWKNYFHYLVSYHYVRLIATLNEAKDDFEYLIVDVNMNPYRKIAVHSFPDWKKNNQEVKEFLAARPGYID